MLSRLPRPMPIALLALSFGPGITMPALAAAEDRNPDQDQRKQELAPVVVQGQAYRSTATKSALTPQETPGSVDEIDRETIEARGAMSVSEALRYTPGITTELRGGAVNRFDQYSIRGFQDARTAYDGLMLLENGWNLAPQIDPWAVESIEVFKGPASVLYGNQSPGGMVNLIARPPRATRSNELRFDVGSRNLVETKGAFTGTAGDLPLTYSVVALGRHNDGQAVTSEEERYVLAPAVDWQLAPDTLLNLNLYMQRDPSAGIYNALPASGMVEHNPHGRLDPNDYAGDANYNTYNRHMLMPGYKIVHDFNERWNILQNFRFTDGSLLQKNTYNTGLGADLRTLGRRAYMTNESEHGITLDNQLAGRIDLGPMEHNVLLGVDYQKLDSNVLYRDAPTLPIDLFDPDNRAINPATLDFHDPTALHADLDLAYEQTGFYLQDQVRWGRLILLGGGRYDRYESREIGDKYNVTVNDHSNETDTTGRGGAMYQFDNGLSPYVSYTQSFEPLPGSNRAGKAFKPSEATQWESGVKFTSQDGRQSATLAGFTITKKNDITRDPSGGPYDVIQAGETRSRGFELNLVSKLLEELTLAFSGSILDATITKDNSGLKGKTPIWAAKQTAALWATWRLPTRALSGAELGGGVRYLGKTKLDARNTGTVPAHTLVDMSLLYDLGQVAGGLQGFAISLAATNLLNKRYYSCYDANNCWFGEERTIMASLRYSF